MLFGTGNPSKLETMRRSLYGSGIEVLGLCDMDKHAPEVCESGNDPLENARIKALAYHRFYGIPVFSLDSGLFFENVPDELQPGVHVRNVGGKHLSDDEMIEYYSSLARRFGGRLTARYKNALCLVMSENEVYTSMDESLWGKAFWLSDTPHSRPHKNGFPLDRLSVEIESGKYYFDLPVSVETEMNKGFRRFFLKIL